VLPGTVACSATQRQWIGLSLAGDSATVEPLSSPSYLESIDLEVGFLRRGQSIAEQFSADEMAKVFVRAYNNVIFGANEILAFEFHGQNLKATVKGLSAVDLPDSQRRGGNSPPDTGVLMEKTDVTFTKAPDSDIKIKSSATKCVLYW
jgi:vesicle-fusing ATPase